MGVGKTTAGKQLAKSLNKDLRNSFSNWGGRLCPKRNTRNFKQKSINNMAQR